MTWLNVLSCSLATRARISVSSRLLKSIGFIPLRAKSLALRSPLTRPEILDLFNDPYSLVRRASKMAPPLGSHMDQNNIFKVKPDE
jgi:hypothetical protein